MENCAELKQTTVKKTINFPKCSIEFELRGATEKEYSKNRERVSNVINNPKDFDLTLKAEKARIDDDFSAFTAEDNKAYTEYNKKIQDASAKSDRELLIYCLTPNPLYTAGYEVTTGDKSAFKDLESIFSVMSKVEIEELESLALTLSTLGTDEVAVEQVKQV